MLLYRNRGRPPRKKSCHMEASALYKQKPLHCPVSASIHLWSILTFGLLLCFPVHSLPSHLFYASVSVHLYEWTKGPQICCWLLVYFPFHLLHMSALIGSFNIFSLLMFSLVPSPLFSQVHWASDMTIAFNSLSDKYLSPFYWGFSLLFFLGANSFVF